MLYSLCWQTFRSVKRRFRNWPCDYWTETSIFAHYKKFYFDIRSKSIPRCLLKQELLKAGNFPVPDKGRWLTFILMGQYVCTCIALALSAYCMLHNTAFRTYPDIALRSLFQPTTAVSATGSQTFNPTKYHNKTQSSQHLVRQVAALGRPRVNYSP